MARVSFEGVQRVGIALACLLLFGVMGIGITIAISEIVPGSGGGEWSVVRNGAYELVGFGLATLVVGRLLSKLAWTELGWPRRQWVSLLRGAGLGGLMAAVAIGLAVWFDGARVHFAGDWNVWPRVALPLALGLVLAALAEELAFRGYPLRRLANAIGVLPAMVLIAGGFAAAHIHNNSVSPLALLNIFLAGIWFSLAFFSPGAMPLAWGAHFGWNASLSILFDAPVSGYAFRVPVVEYTPGTHEWIDGGFFGPEGGIVATIALGAGTLYLLTRKAAFNLQPAAEPEQVAAG